MKRATVLLLALAFSAATAQEVTLSFKFKKDESIRYKETIDQQMTAEGMPGGGQNVKNIRYTKMFIKSVEDDGTAEVIRSTDSSTTFMNDKPFANPQAAKLEGMQFRMKMTKAGKVLEVGPVSEPADDMTKRLASSMVEQYKQNPGLPDKLVKVGDTWDDEMNTNQDTPSGRLTMKVKTTTKLAGFENGLAVLDVSGTLSGELGAGMGVISGTVKGKRWFAQKEGRESRSEMTMDQNMDMQTQQGNMVMQIKMVQTKGEGWVDYMWVHPQTKKIAGKSSFSKKLANYDGWVAVGIYR